MRLARGTESELTFCAAQFGRAQSAVFPFPGIQAFPQGLGPQSGRRRSGQP